MTLKYDIEISNGTISKDIDRLTNLIFKLLPYREEGGDWRPSLQNLIYEITGLSKLLVKYDELDFLILLCKLEALLSLNSQDDFLNFRRLIFECLNLLSGFKKCLV